MQRIAMALALLALATPALAKRRGGGGGAGHAANSRAVGELAGKFKWGMSPEDTIKVLSAQVHAKYVELMKKEPDVYKQDLLRKQERDEVQKACRTCPGDVSESSFVARAAVEKARMMNSLSDDSPDGLKAKLFQAMRFISSGE